MDKQETQSGLLNRGNLLEETGRLMGNHRYQETGDSEDVKGHFRDQYDLPVVEELP